MSKLDRWLEGLGLSKYSKLFAENAIDLDILPDLTETDLRELSIPIGDRKRLLKAAAVLTDESGAFRPPRTALAPLPEAERRQLTVMFCDLVGSTELSTRFDPEDMREVIRAYQDVCTTVITQFDGYVAKYMGDGVLVYFGYPHAHGNDAERAARTGLAIVGAINSAGAACPTVHDVKLAVRIGINTGLVVVGDIVGEGAAEEASVVGETPNVAARLQALAEPNQVVIGPLTRELIGESLACEDLGEHQLKGIAEGVRAWRVLYEVDADNRYEALAVGGGLPLIGRQEELGLLVRSWEASKQGHGQAVLIQGEAGIGKSRLLEALREQIVGEDYIWVAIRCSPYHANSTLYPVIEYMKRVIGWGPEDDAEQKLEKLEAALERQNFSPEEAVPLFAELLSMPLPRGRYAASELSSKQKREKTLDALAGWLLDEAERTPVLQVWEDLHWVDPTTLELLTIYIEQSPMVSMLNVLTYRPRFVPPWSTHSHITPITLNRLERPEAVALIKHQANRKSLPAVVIEHIVGKADGVPLYVEELTKTILESDYMREEADRYTLVGSLSEVSIPATLQDSLMARLDRLPEVREVAQLGAVLGREFAYEILAALVDLDESSLQQGLRQLVNAELLYQRGRPPRAKYIFKHALVQDAAYESLLKRTRQQYHRRVAALMEERFAEIVTAHPELIAHHLAEAGCTNEAVAYFQKAGKIALERSANAEAASHFERGLELLSQLPETRERNELELQIQMAIGPALVATRGFADTGVGRAYARAWELCNVLEDVDRLPLVLRGRQVFHLLKGEINKAGEFAKQLLDLAERRQDSALLVGGCHAVGQTLFQHGELIDARRTVEKGIALFDPEKHRLSNWSGGQPGEQCFLFGAFTLWMLGFPDQAKRLSREALALANALPNAANLVNTLAFVATVHVLRRELSDAQQQAKAAKKMSTEQGNQNFLGHATVLHGWAQAAQGKTEDGIAEIQQGIATYRATGARTWVPFFLGLQAETYLQTDRIDDGLASVIEALEIADKTEQHAWQAELYRIKGELLALSPHNHADAKSCFSRALKIAHRQNARSWELRTAVSLGRLWQQRSMEAEARDLLSPIYDWFTEGSDTTDLSEARALLEELALSQC